LSTPVSVYRCPTDTYPNPNPKRGHNDSSLPNRFIWGTSSYTVNAGYFMRFNGSGTAALPSSSPAKLGFAMANNGAMYLNSSNQIRDFTDGTSNTFLVGEHHGGDPQDLWEGGTWPGQHRAQTHSGNNVASCVALPINMQTPGHADKAFASLHVGGAHFALCDGSVRFISETIDFSRGPDTATTYNSVTGLAAAGGGDDVLLRTASYPFYGTYQRLGIRNDGQVIGEF
jgi:hypothetical protein